MPIANENTAVMSTAVLSQKMRKELVKRLVGKSFVNTDFESQIKRGQVLKIPTPGAITVAPYTGDDLTPQKASTSSVDLTVNQAWGFVLEVLDSEVAQSIYLDPTVWGKKGAYGLLNELDKFIFKTLADGAATANKIVGNTPTAENVADYLSDMRGRFDAQGIPPEMCKVALSSRLHNLVAQDRSIRETSIGDKALLDGRLSRHFGFDIEVSHNLATNEADLTSGQEISEYAICVYQPNAMTLVHQLEKMETSRIPLNFGTYYKGVSIFGGVVTDPNAVGSMKFLTGVNKA